MQYIKYNSTKIKKIDKVRIKLARSFKYIKGIKLLYFNILHSNELIDYSKGYPKAKGIDVKVYGISKSNVPIEDKI